MNKKQRIARDLKQLAQDAQDAQELKNLNAERISLENELLLLNHKQAVRGNKGIHNFN